MIPSFSRNPNESEQRWSFTSTPPRLTFRGEGIKGSGHKRRKAWEGHRPSRCRDWFAWRYKKRSEMLFGLFWPKDLLGKTPQPFSLPPTWTTQPAAWSNSGTKTDQGIYEAITVAIELFRRLFQSGRTRVIARNRFGPSTSWPPSLHGQPPRPNHFRNTNAQIILQCFNHDIRLEVWPAILESRFHSQRSLGKAFVSTQSLRTSSHLQAGVGPARLPVVGQNAVGPASRRRQVRGARVPRSFSVFGPSRWYLSSLLGSKGIQVPSRLQSLPGTIYKPLWMMIF